MKLSEISATLRKIHVSPVKSLGQNFLLDFNLTRRIARAAGPLDGVTVVVDRMSVPYLNGAQIDFVDTIEKQGFTIDNPNATGSCACGDSFH